MSPPSQALMPVRSDGPAVGSRFDAPGLAARARGRSSTPGDPLPQVMLGERVVELREAV